MEHRIKVLRHMFPDCYREIDGYWVWWAGGTKGSFAPADLRVMSEILEEANRMWDLQVKADLGA